jgi:hypothetical protein
MYATNAGLLFTDLPSEAAVSEKGGAIYDTPEAAWSYLLGVATSYSRAWAVAIDNIDMGKLAGTEAELRTERAYYTRKLRRLQKWIKFAMARC